MENHPYIFPLLVSVVVSLGFVSCTLCVAAEFKKSKVKDLSVDGKLCSLPESAAFRLGLAALACSSVAQIVGNLFLCGKFMSMERECGCGKTKKPKTAIFFLVLSCGLRPLPLAPRLSADLCAADGSRHQAQPLTRRPRCLRSVGQQSAGQQETRVLTPHFLSGSASHTQLLVVVLVNLACWLFSQSDRTQKIERPSTMNYMSHL
nr:Glutamate receptor 3.1 like [Ipomoea batatas]